MLHYYCFFFICALGSATLNCANYYNNCVCVRTLWVLARARVRCTITTATTTTITPS